MPNLFKMPDKMDECINIKCCYIPFDRYIILIPTISRNNLDNITIWKKFHVFFQFRSYCFLSNPTIQKINRKYTKNTCTRVQKFKLTLDGFSCYNVTKYHSTSMRTNCNQYYWTWMHAILSGRGANKVTNIKKMPQIMVEY